MITYPYENLFKKDSIDKQLHIVGDGINLGNTDIYQESFELEECLNGDVERDIQYGDCVSHILKFTTSFLGELKGKDIEVSVVLDNHTDEPFTFGTFTIYEAKYTADRTKKEVTAYDALYKINNANVIDWYNTVFPDLETTITLKNFRDSFFNEFGVTQEAIVLDNDNVLLTKTINAEKLSGADVIRNICSMNGCFGKINREGNFEYFYVHQTTNPIYPAITLYPSPDIYPAFDGDYDAIEVGNNGTYISCFYEDFDVMPVDKLIIRDEEGEVGVSYGEGTNAYVLQGNFLLFNFNTSELTTIAENIYNRIAGAYYRPCEIECKGNPCLEVGDGIFVRPTNGQRFVTIISKRVYKGIQAQRDTYTTEGTQYRDEEVNSYDSQIYALRGKSNKLTRDLEHTISELANFEEGVASEFEQTASDISAKVSKNSPTGQTSFSWEMVDTKMEWKTNGSTVMKVDSTGAEINGKITATSGYIGSSSQGFVIDSDDIHNGMTSLNDTSHNGVYVGTDGLACGKGKIKLTSTGNGQIGAWGFGDNGFTYSNGQGATATMKPSGSGSLGGIQLDSQSIDITASRTATLEGDTSVYLTSEGGVNYTLGASNARATATIDSHYDDNVNYAFRIITGSNNDFEVYTPKNNLIKSAYNTSIKAGSIASINGGSYVQFLVNNAVIMDVLSTKVTSSKNIEAPAFVPTSDRKLKDDIKELDFKKSSKFIMELKPCEYIMKSTGEKHHGFIAQDVEELIDDNWDIVSQGENKGLHYIDIIADLVATVQNQQKQIDELKSILNKMEGD